MPTITTVDATWDTGVNMDAAELRRADSAMFLGDGSNNGVRGGIVRHGDNSLAVSVNGSDQVTVQAGAFVIPAATGLGVYRGALQSSTAATALAARNGTNPRIDLVVIQATGSGATVKTIEGTPGSSPSAPALPASAVELARLNVPAVGGGAVTVDNSWRQYATAIGGIVYRETAARLPGSGNLRGQRGVALDSKIEHIWSGSAWHAQIPVTHDSGGLGPSSNFTNTAQAPWTTSAWSFTPTRDGWATITAELDTQDVSSGYGSASAAISTATDGLIDETVIRFEGGSRLSSRFIARRPVRVLAGVGMGVALDVWNFSGSGSWKINLLTWRVTVM